MQNIKKQPTLADNDHAWYDTKPGLKWDLIKPFFQKALKTKEVLNEIDTCEQFLQAGLIDSSGKAIQNIFLQAANASLAPHNTPIINKASHNNKRGNSNTKNKPKQKWFDKECHERKKMANALSIKKHDSPFNRQMAKEHKLALKLYKQTCNSKKHNFWRKETSRLDEALNSNEKFWKTWQTIGKLKLKTSTTTPNGVRWENYYSNLYKKHKSNNIDNILPKALINTNLFLNKEISMVANN